MEISGIMKHAVTEYLENFGLFRFRYGRFNGRIGELRAFQWSQSSNPMTTSEVEGFQFKDKNETGDAEKFDSFDGLAMASTDNAESTVLENPTTKFFWIGQKNDAPIKGIGGGDLVDSDYVTLQIKRESGGNCTKLN